MASPIHSLMPHCDLCVNICVLHNVFCSEKVDEEYQDVFISFHFK